MAPVSSTAVPRLGLRPNRVQFTLLAIDNVCVGMLIGSERTVVPLLGLQSFHVTSFVVLLSFVVAFGAVKGPLNLLAGHLADRYGRRRVLLLGWVLGLPVPWLLLVAPAWGWIVAANLLVGANQGFAWTMTVTSKIDLVGPRQRGFALGINEFSGYVGVAIASAVTGTLAGHFGLRPAPFVFAAAVSIVGLLIPVFAVRETRAFAHLEAASSSRAAREGLLALGQVFRRVSWEDRAMFACCQAGMLNKFSDTAVWVLVPVAMAMQRFGTAAIGATVGAYALTWGVTQLGTGALSDRLGRRPLIVAGLVLNGLGLAAAAEAGGQVSWLAAAVAMGLGTALLYPVLLAAVSDAAHPAWRATALGVYRLWRDGGYALGGLAVGIGASWLGPRDALLTLAALLFASGSLVGYWMRSHNVLREPTIVPQASEL
jgi:MFS family permease